MTSPPLHPIRHRHRATSLILVPLVALTFGGISLEPYATSGYLPQGPLTTDTGHFGGATASHTTPIFEYAERTWFHPLRVGTNAIRLLREGRTAMAVEQAEDLLARSYVDGYGRWYPYSFPWPMTDGQALDPGWVSAMTQGRMLSLHTMLYRETGDERWRMAADETFATLAPQSPVAHVDDGVLWLEEYPTAQPQRVLNGHIFAAFGLHDYARVFADEGAARLFDAAATAVRLRIDEYRRPNGVSLYSLRSQQLKPTYHRVHIGQLATLAILTGDPTFSELSSLLESDYSLDDMQQ